MCMQKIALLWVLSISVPKHTFDMAFKGVVTKFMGSFMILVLV